MDTSSGVGRGRTGCVQQIFGRPRGVVIGVIHCPAFPGSPRYQGASSGAIYAAALADAVAYAKGGVDGLIIENHGDVPFSKPDAIGPETSPHKPPFVPPSMCKPIKTELCLTALTACKIK
jgi:hypothetical protein